MHTLENRVSMAFQQAITSNHCTFQLVPPHVYQHNVAEQANGLFKDHFLAMFMGVAPTYPKDWWDILLPQAKLELNLLCPSPPRNLHGNTSLGRTTLMQHQWAQLDAAYSSSGRPCFNNHGITTVKMATTLAPLYNIIGATKQLTRPQGQQFLSAMPSRFAIIILSKTSL